MPPATNHTGRCLQLSKFYPPVLGGIETVTYDIATGLLSRGWEVDVLCASTDNRTHFEAGEISIVRGASLGRVASTSIAPSLIKHLIRIHNRYDVIHVHLPDPMTNLALFFARPTSKIIVHWHSDIVKQKTLLKLYAPLQEWLLKRADRIICTSEPYAVSSPWLKAYLDKVCFIPCCIHDPLNSVNARTISDQVQTIKSQFGRKKIVFALGRLTYYKGFDVLIQAATRLPLDTVVLLGGDGELAASLRSKVKALGLEDRFHFVGRIPVNKLAAFYEAADVFCLPSLLRSEAFGVVMLEAMSHSLPIVATNIPGSGVSWVNQDGETGLNVTPGDPKELADALTKLLEDKELSKTLGTGARRRFEKNFNISQMIDSVESVYSQLTSIN